MRFLAFTLAMLGSLLASRSAPAQVVNFEDLPLSTQSYNNGQNLPGYFTSGGATFNNNYDPTYGSWSAWAYSNVTDVSTAAPDYSHQYAAYSLHNTPPGSGAGNSSNYAIAYASYPGEPTIQLPAGTRPVSVQLTNSTYTASSMLFGDGFARQFSVATQDYFELTITGLDAGNHVTGVVNFFLADYRFATADQAYIVSDWTTVDLTSLGDATQLSFAFESSDVGQYGINTPTYVAVDNLALAPVPEPGTLLLTASAVGGLTLRRLRRRG